jgi:hypothetical protein
MLSFNNIARFGREKSDNVIGREYNIDPAYISKEREKYI